jgi:hypothetical protein
VAQKGFFSKIVQLLFGKDGQNDGRDRLLNKQQQQLKQYPKYYKVSHDELQPAIAQLLYTVYYLVAPYKASLAHAIKSDQLKNITIQAFLYKNHQELLANQMDIQSLRRLAATQDENKVRTEFQSEIQIIISYLHDLSMMNQIDVSYAYLVYFIRFISFDFHRLLSHFDSNLPLNNFSYKPRFGSLQAKLVVDDLIEFSQLVTPLLGSDVDWQKLFDILSNYRNAQFMPLQQWSKVLSNVREFMNTRVLQLIIRRAFLDPYWDEKLSLTVTDIVKPYTAKLKQQADALIKQLSHQERDKMASKISQEVFSGQEFARTLKHYNEEQAQKMFTGIYVDGFIYANVLNAISSFGRTYLVSDVQKTVDLLILHGKWSNNDHYKQFSQAFQSLLVCEKEIQQFDTKLSDESSNIVRLRNALRNANREKSALNTAKGILGELNDEAFQFLTLALQNYMMIARALKIYIDDYKKQVKSEIILNWKEVEHRCDTSLPQSMADIYTRIYYLIQMIQQYVN